MEAATLVATASAVPAPTGRDLGDPTAAADRPVQSTDELRRLTDIADRYAHHLVAAVDPPPGVLLLVEHGGLDVITLVGPALDVRALPRLLAKHRPSSAAVVVADQGTLGAATDVVLVVGETSDGLRDERRFRVRPCGRTRRLTRLLDRDASESPRLIPRLFPRPIPTS